MECDPHTLPTLPQSGSDMECDPHTLPNLPQSATPPTTHTQSPPFSSPPLQASSTLPVSLPLSPLSIPASPDSPSPTHPLSSPSKPPYSFSSLIFMAIEDSPDKRLPVKGIYEWIVNSFPYYSAAPAGWRNSVRHNLSLSKSFRRIHCDRSQVRGVFACLGWAQLASSPRASSWLKACVFGCSYRWSGKARCGVCLQSIDRLSWRC
uniref:Fork-head domain-containing protein n=1 Tax=Esox lucius TaxID=8010 RepID=A0AAY5KW56_ESOLU